MEDFLMHYGRKRRSGRYPYGSGDNPYQHEDTFLHEYYRLKEDGYTDNDIAKEMGLSTTEFRQKRSYSLDAQRFAQATDVIRMHDEQGLGWTEIGRKMGIPEGTVRNLYKPALLERNTMTENTSEALKKSVLEKQYIDIGPGIENYLGISRTKLKTAVRKLVDEEGYEVHTVYMENPSNGKKVARQFICRPGIDYNYISKNPDLIKLPIEYSENGGRTFLGLEPIQSVDSSRVMIRYADDPNESGKLKDGVIELRDGVEDLSLNGKTYAQVRIAVDGTHYLKGMAVKGTNMPDGVDIIFNTNKTSDISKMDVMKKMSDDPDNPFGSTVKQRHYIGADGKDHISAINVVASSPDKLNEEGRWNEWSNTLSSQFLSKQSPELARKQLGIAYDRAAKEHDELISLTNPVIKKELLLKFAEQCDSDAVHLKAAALPRQSTHVILPITDMPENQIYAPKYRDGEKVVLIRYPHGGIFEIPELIVNNNHKTAKKVMDNSQDAVGINPKVAEQLSGADFDGDTVVVIPTAGVKIKTDKMLQGLKDFDAKIQYKLPDDAPRISTKTKNNEMGRVSNLITDMTLQGASPDEICRAVKHSMVVIDSEKHHLNYKQSYEDFRIQELKDKYQNGGGASTLISKASSEYSVNERKQPVARKSKHGEAGIDPNTGEWIFEETGRTYQVAYVKKIFTDPETGKTRQKTEKISYYPGKKVDGEITRIVDVPAQQSSTWMAETKDAFTLSSGTKMETVYATHANKMKALANQARKEAIDIQMPKINPSAKETYQEEYASLMSKLNTARKNKPLERQAIARANYIIKEKKAANPNLKNDKDAMKKIRTQALNEARYEVGSKSRKERGIDISDKEWEAIQAGAISANRLKQIIDNADEKRLRQLATPRQKRVISEAKQAKIRNMKNKNYSIADIADAIGVSPSTVLEYIND